MTRPGTNVVLYVCHELADPTTSLQRLVEYAHDAGFAVYDSFCDTCALHTKAEARPQWRLAAAALESGEATGLIAPTEMQLAFNSARQNVLRAWLIENDLFAHYPLQETGAAPPRTPKGMRPTPAAEAITRILVTPHQGRVQPGDVRLNGKLFPQDAVQAQGPSAHPQRGALLAVDEPRRRPHGRLDAATNPACLAKLAHRAAALLAQGAPGWKLHRLPSHSAASSVSARRQRHHAARLTLATAALITVLTVAALVYPR